MIQTGASEVSTTQPSTAAAIPAAWDATSGPLTPPTHFSNAAPAATAWPSGCAGSNGCCPTHASAWRDQERPAAVWTNIELPANSPALINVNSSRTPRQAVADGRANTLARNGRDWDMLPPLHGPHRKRAFRHQ